MNEVFHIRTALTGCFFALTRSEDLCQMLFLILVNPLENQTCFIFLAISWFVKREAVTDYVSVFCRLSPLRSRFTQTDTFLADTPHFLHEVEQAKHFWRNDHSLCLDEQRLPRCYQESGHLHHAHKIGRRVRQAVRAADRQAAYTGPARSHLPRQRRTVCAKRATRARQPRQELRAPSSCATT